MDVYIPRAPPSQSAGAHVVGLSVLTILDDASSSREMVTKRDPKRRHEKRRGGAGIRRAILRDARIRRHRPSGVHVDMHYAADVARAIRLSTRSRFRIGAADKRPLVEITSLLSRETCLQH